MGVQVAFFYSAKLYLYGSPSCILLFGKIVPLWESKLHSFILQNCAFMRVQVAFFYSAKLYLYGSPSCILLFCKIVPLWESKLHSFIRQNCTFMGVQVAFFYSAKLYLYGSPSCILLFCRKIIKLVLGKALFLFLYLCHPVVLNYLKRIFNLFLKLTGMFPEEKLRRKIFSHYLVLFSPLHNGSAKAKIEAKISSFFGLA